MIPACPAEMLLTQRLKTGTLPVLMGSDPVKSVMLTTGPFAFKYGQLVFWRRSPGTEAGQDGKFFKTRQ